MSYGLAAGLIGMNQGLRQSRQDQRQNEQDEMTRERYGIQMEAAKENMAASRDNRSWTNESRDRQRTEWQQQDQSTQIKNELNQALAKWSIGRDPSGLFDFHEQTFGNRPMMTQDGKISYLEGGRPVDVPMEDYLEQAAMAVMDDGYIQQIEARRAARQQQAEAESEHGRKMEIERFKAGKWDPDETGTMAYRTPGQTYQIDPMARGSGDQTALERNTQHYINVFRMSPQVATLAAAGRLRPDEARREARSLAQKFIQPNSMMSVPQFVRTNPADAERLGITDTTSTMEALRLLEEDLAKQFSGGTGYEQYQGYGIPMPGQATPQQGSTQAPPASGQGSSPGAQPAPARGDGSSPQSPLDAASLTAQPPAGTYISITGRTGVRDGVYRVEEDGTIRRVVE